MCDNTHAVGQMKGYMLQVRHMLFELISLDDINVSIEKIDDVAIETPDGNVIAEQLKSVTSEGNPATDRSAVFWKTLYNWFNYVNNGDLVPKTTTFRMVIVSNRLLKASDIAIQFHEALKKEDALKALSAAKLSIWGQDEALKNGIPESYRSYLEVLFAPDNEDLVGEIITKFKIDIHGNDYDEKLTNKFNGQTIPPEYSNNLLIYMLGWVTDEVNKYNKEGLPAIISSAHYRKTLIAQCRMYNQKNSLPMLSHEITSNQVRTEVESQDVYIQQLDLIQMDFDDKLTAASDYLQTKAETTIRSEKGLFTPQTLKDYNDRVCRIWKGKRSQGLLSASYTDVMKGQQLYAQMSETAPQIDSALPSFFGSGTMQSLANEPRENPKIGWHPNYKKCLKGDV